MSIKYAKTRRKLIKGMTFLALKIYVQIFSRFVSAEKQGSNCR